MIKVLKVMEYHKIPVCLRMIGGEVFMYDFMHKNQFFSSYLVIRPAKGKEKLSDTEIVSSMHLIDAGAKATIDMLLGVQLSKEDTKKAKMVLGVN